MQKNKIIFFFIFSILFPSVAFGASLSVSPSNFVVEAGNRISIKVVVSSDSSINAVSGNLLVPPSFFEVESVSKASSVLNFWVTEPSISKVSGIVKFEGVALNGFSGSGGGIVTLNLKALKTGTGSISFQTGQVLANDGQGTDVTKGLTGATFAIKDASVKPITPEKKPEVVVPAPTVEPEPAKISLKAPEIVYGSKYGEPAIVGESEYPRAQVLLTFVAEDGSKIFITGKADEDGGFTILVPKIIKHGPYSVTAVMIEDDGKQSLFSNQITINFGNLFSDIGLYVWILILIILLLVSYLIFKIISKFYKNKNITPAIKKEIHQAESVLHDSFNILRKDVTSKVVGKEDTLDEKKDQIEKIKEHLDYAEKALSKEIKDIDSL